VKKITDVSATRLLKLPFLLVVSWKGCGITDKTLVEALPGDMKKRF